MQRMWKDRTEAGRRLAGLLGAYRSKPGVIVLALPRGGVVVGAEIASALGVPLDVLTVRKLGVPFQPELAMGAVASGGVRVLHEDLIRGFGISREEVEAETASEKRELTRRERAYRGDRPPLDLAGKTVILVDDGIATGATMEAAISALRQRKVARIVVGVAVGPADTITRLRTLADEVVCPLAPEQFSALSLWYEAFPQTQDDEVKRLLSQVNSREEV